MQSEDFQDDRRAVKKGEGKMVQAIDNLVQFEFQETN